MRLFLGHVAGVEAGEATVPEPRPPQGPCEVERVVEVPCGEQAIIN